MSNLVNGHVDHAINGESHSDTDGTANGSRHHQRTPSFGQHFVIDYGDRSEPRHFEVTEDGDVSRQRGLDGRPDASARPNIVFIMADQMAAPILKVHDKDSPVKTPNIDRLAEDGVVFDSAYCNSPLCAPARFVMLTGKLPHKIGAYDNAGLLASDEPTFAHYLRREGYETSLAGKMHFIGPDQLHGYEQRLTPDIYPGDFGWSVNWDKPDERQEWYHNMSSVNQAGPCVRSNQLDFDEEVVYKSTQYLYDWARQNPDTRRPFFLNIALTHPHDPYTITDEYWSKYDDVDIPLPKYPLPQEKQDNHGKRIMECIDLWDRPMKEEAIKRARRAYFGSCSYVDAQLGHLMQVLKNIRADKDTLVIFSGDHGDMLGERNLWYKMNYYEMSARVPMIVHYPARFKPHRVAESVSTMDLLPTFCDIIGTKLHPALPIDGKSFYPALLGTGKAPGEVIGEYMGEGTISPLCMIRRGHYKYIFCLADPPQLYNISEDPLEKNNLCNSKSPEHIKLANAFDAEAKERWDLPTIHKEVLSSQRRRRLTWGALKMGAFLSWDYQPHDDASTKYIRSTIPLDDLERRARFPAVDSHGKESWLATHHGHAAAAGE